MTESTTPVRQSAPIVFVGPSIPVPEARAILADAEYRPPVRRGDLDGVPDGALVGIIDGVFDQDLSVSPREIRNALARGVWIYGSSSMGALRAAEVEGMVGIGHIYSLFRRGILERDDEVALLFDPDSGRPLSEPLVNVRHAVERLVQAGTVEQAVGRRIVSTAARLHYPDRTYPTILRRARLAASADAAELSALLRTFDLKREDAHLLLERMDRHRREPQPPCPSRPLDLDDNDRESTVRAAEQEAADAAVHVWEYGDTVAFDELLLFLKLTGKYTLHARNAVGRAAIAGRRLTDGGGGERDPSPTAQALFDWFRGEWGWLGEEETHVTLRDVGLGIDDLSQSLDDEARTVATVAAAARAGSDGLSKALRAELWMNRLALKREVLRLGAVRFFAGVGAAEGPPSAAERDDARRVLCKVNSLLRWPDLVSQLHRLAVPDGDRDAFVDRLALTRRVAGPLARVLDGAGAGATTPAGGAPPTVRRWARGGFRPERTPKPRGSARFSLDLRQAERHTTRIARRIGIRRVGLIGQLGDLGVQVAQAFRTRPGWSSTISSGKSATARGARVGSVMEEVEVFAQDAFRPARERVGSFQELVGRAPVVDPSTLGLPYDSCYTPALPLRWTRCFDLITCRPMWIPSAVVVTRRAPHDILYSERRGGKVYFTNGLASGFTVAEAALHATCEYIERHAQRLAELELENPGGCGVRSFRFIDPSTVPPGTRQLLRRLTRSGMQARVLDITGEVRVPTFQAQLSDDPFRQAAQAHEGFGCHPNPEVAMNVALLEAAQTKAGNIAGAREDFTIKARSLGRHERPRTLTDAYQMFWHGIDPPQKSAADLDGLVASEVRAELEWTVRRVQQAGYRHLLLVDYSCPEIAPAHAVRVVIAGMECTNPYYTGPRARATAIRDLLPRHTPSDGRRRH
jgi:ribosomal protein S12 methylthiotransferase accessory factor